MKANHEALLEEISKRTLIELDLVVSESGDIIEILGETSQANEAPQENSATIQTAPAQGMVGTPKDMATSAQSMSATPGGKNEVSKNHVESEVARSTATELQFPNDSEVDNAGDATAQQNVDDLTEETPADGRACDNEDKDMEGSTA